jgi:hypothetical protein
MSLAIVWIARRLRSLQRTLTGPGASARATESLDNLFVQLEALDAIYRDLKLGQSLPPTRGWAASPDFLHRIVAHTLGAKPGTIMECGSGVSTVVLARCAQLNGHGHVYSLEHDGDYAQRTRASLASHGLSAHATVLHAPLTKQSIAGTDLVWYDASQWDFANGIDLLVVDGPPGSDGHLARYPCGPALFSRLSSQGTVYLDDASRPEEQAAVHRWLQECPRLRMETAPCEKGCTILRNTGE